MLPYAAQIFKSSCQTKLLSRPYKNRGALRPNYPSNYAWMASKLLISY